MVTTLMMNTQKHDIKVITVMALIAMPIIYLAYRLVKYGLATGLKTGSYLYAGLLVFPAMALVVICALFLQKPLTEILSQSFVDFLFGRHHVQRPEPKYGIPEFQHEWRHFEEAILEYEKIAVNFPEELKPWADMIEIVMLKLKDPDRATKMFHKGIAKLKDEKKRKELTIIYLAHCSRIGFEPELQNQKQV